MRCRLQRNDTRGVRYTDMTKPACTTPVIFAISVEPQQSLNCSCVPVWPQALYKRLAFEFMNRILDVFPVYFRTHFSHVCQRFSFIFLCVLYLHEFSV